MKAACRLKDQTYATPEGLLAEEAKIEEDKLPLCLGYTVSCPLWKVGGFLDRRARCSFKGLCPCKEKKEVK